MNSNLEKINETLQKDLKPFYSILDKESSLILSNLQEELSDNFLKKQIFRTETEIRISVLNEGKFPTKASKYWQSVREMDGQLQAVVDLSFRIRKLKINRQKLQRKLQKAIDNKDDLKQLDIELALDQNFYLLLRSEQEAHDRVREISIWSKIKTELNDGSFNTTDVDVHQAHTFKYYFDNRIKALSSTSEPADIINALGPYTSLQKLSKDGRLLKYNELQKLNNPDKFSKLDQFISVKDNK